MVEGLSGASMVLPGVVKDILLVSGSVIIMGSTVTFAQMVGYSIALGGLVVFKTPAVSCFAHI